MLIPADIVMGYVFWSTLGVVILLDLALVATLVVPSVQVWPPPGPDGWAYGFTWTLFGVAALGVIVVGGLDRGTLGIASWMGTTATFIVGSLVFMVGTAIASYPMGCLGRRAALGLEDELVTGGPYAVSRNPAYIGDLTMLVGYVILSDSELVGVLALVAAVWYVCAPLAEEPWLERRYGEQYLQYKEAHPRWLI